MADEKGPGRPSKYKPEYCEMLIEHMAYGYSFESFGAKADVCEDTLFEWAKTHPEFMEAKKLAFIKCRFHWEKKGMDNMHNEPHGPSFNTTLWIFNMKNRFKWRDKHSDENETVINNTVNNAVNDEAKKAELEDMKLQLKEIMERK